MLKSEGLGLGELGRFEVHLRVELGEVEIPRELGGETVEGHCSFDGDKVSGNFGDVGLDI